MKVKSYIFKETLWQVTIYVDNVFYCVDWFQARGQARDYAKNIKIALKKV